MRRPYRKESAVGFAVVYLLSLVLFLFPLWKIFGKTGLHPALSLLVLVPGFGGLICLLVLAFARWPATDPD